MRVISTVALSLLVLAPPGCAVPDRDDEIAKGEVPVDRGRLDRFARLVRVVEPVSLDEPELAHVLALRRAWGLSTEVDFVQALHDHPAEFAATRSTALVFAGLLLDESELDAAIERAEVEYAGPAADRWAHANLADRYAGSFLEGPSVVLLCTGCEPDEVATRIGADPELPEVLRGRIEVRRVAYRLVDLARREARLAGWLRARGLRASGTTVDVIDNDVDLLAGPDALAELAAELVTIERVVGGPIDLVPLDGETQEDIAKNEALGYGIVEAGQAIGRKPGVPWDAWCTTAFAVQNGYGPFILTAGHCVVDGQQLYQAGWPLGRVAARYNRARFDGALVSTASVRNAIGRVHVSFADDFHPVTFPVTDHDLFGQTVCQTGITTTCMSGNCNPSTRCGTVTSQTYRPDESREPVWGLANYHRAGGDSGAAVYWPTLYGLGAAGVHSGGALVDGTILDNLGYFSRMPVIAHDWGLSLISY